MLTMDVFSGNAFSSLELTAAINLIPHKPAFLGELGLFAAQGVRTTKAAIEKRDNTLALVPTSPRGAPLPQLGVDPRNVRDVSIPRVAKGDTLWAAELQSIRAFGSDTELMSLQDEVTRREIKLRDDIELTLENMRLGAVQGIVTDADGSTLINWFTTMGITQAAEIDFNLDAASPVAGALRTLIQTEVVRPMARAIKGPWSGRIMALCSDEFYDALIQHADVRTTYLNWAEAADLRKSTAFSSFPFAGVEWMNYRGTDDKTTVGIPANKVKFFPVGAPGVFQRYNAPGESFEWVNTPGQEWYSHVIPDRDRNAFVTTEIYTYPLFVCTRPETLLRGKLT